MSKLTQIEMVQASELKAVLTPNKEVVNGMLATFDPELLVIIKREKRSLLDTSLTLVCMASEVIGDFEQAFNLVFGDDAWQGFLLLMLKHKNV